MTTASSFVHLHQHTEYSLLDGASKVGKVAKAAAEDGQPALAATDHGNLYGTLEFYKACTEAGVKPIIGFEAYQAHDHRSERLQRASRAKEDDGGGDAEGGRKAYYHLTLLAENKAGYKNLIQLSSRAFLEGFYSKPRLDWELLSEHSEGLIATTGCLGGHVLQALLRGDENGALEKAGRLQDIFGKNNLFVELQDHGIPEQHRTNPILLDIAKKIDAPLVCVNDSHYVHAGDAIAHDSLLCVQTGAKLADEDRFKFHGDQHYLKTAQEMRYLFREVEVGCDNTLVIAERCNVEIEFGDIKLPAFPIPEGFESDDQYLQHLAVEGFNERYPNATDDVKDRLAYELKTIADMGFSSYFLIVWDLIRFAKENGIRVGASRGSVGGCIVAYCLRITDLDPIKYDLLFERFLNPARVSMPDIDTDYESRHRDKMIQYAVQKYGRDRVAQIITFSQIRARAAVRDAARVLDKPYIVGDKIAKAMPKLIAGRDTPLAACLEYDAKYQEGFHMAAPLREMYESDPEVQEVVDIAMGLEGLRRSDGIHAAAVVIAPEPVVNFLPVQRKPKAGTDPSLAPIVTQYEMHGVEDLGLLKMDFLALSNLDVISDCLALVKKVRGIDVDIDNVPLDDPKTYEMLREADTVGVFQLEGSQMRNLMRLLAPTDFDDVAALIALYRPGPMAANMHNDYADRKNGRKPVEYLHPDAEECLSDTQGLMIYQESVMRIAQKFAGYSLSEADNLRKAVGKKIREKIAKEREKFVEGCVKTGYPRELGDQWFDIIEPFADYAFPRAHSYGYGLISFQTAYLKANFPVEYLAALMSNADKLDRIAIYLNDCRKHQIAVRVPDVNASEVNFTTTPEGEIIYGLESIGGLGSGSAGAIVAEREANGPYKDFVDFCARVDLSVLNKGHLEALIGTGGFDSLGHTRKGLLSVYEAIVDEFSKRRKKEKTGQFDLFSIDPDITLGDFIIPEGEFTEQEILKAEKKRLGLYVSGHPLTSLVERLEREATQEIADLLDSDPDGNYSNIAGLIASVDRKSTKKGDRMAILVVEDLGASIEVVVFPRTFAEYGHLLEEGAVVVINGRYDVELRGADEYKKFYASRINLIETQSQSYPPIHLKVPDGIPGEKLAHLRSVIQEFPGSAEIVLHLGTNAVKLPMGTRLTETVLRETRSVLLSKT